LNGANFQIAETGFTWLLGEQQKPGTVGIGAWHQHGKLQASPGISENNTTGYYLFGSQRLWYKNLGVDDSGISGYYQFGYNKSRAMLMNQSIGAGLTAFGLMPKRVDDSFGAGVTYAWINTNDFHQPHELLLQTYYQAKVIDGIYLEPVISYIPTPAANNTSNNVWAGTLRAIVLF
jgi:porin